MSLATDIFEPPAATGIPTSGPEEKTGGPQVSLNSRVQAHDFRSAGVMPANELRSFRVHQIEFAAALGSRLSLFLRLDATTRLAAVQTMTFQKLAQTWPAPTHLTLFKLEPLRGIGTLEIQPTLGSALLDRLMGGSGVSSNSAREYSEIEMALLEQAARLVLNEWCGRWRGVKELKPTVIGQETNGHYVQTASPETIMVLVTVEAQVGRCSGNLQLAIPYASLEALIRQVTPGREHAVDTASLAAKSAPRWNSTFDDVCVPINAEWEGIEMPARDLLTLKVGDVLRFDPKNAGQVRVSVADRPCFNGRPGMVGGKWAVELTRAVSD